MKNKFYKYYLTKSTREEILAGNGEFWEEEDGGWQVFTRNLNLAKSWYSVEDLKNNFPNTKYEIAIFKNGLFLDFFNS